LLCDFLVELGFAAELVFAAVFAGAVVDAAPVGAGGVVDVSAAIAPAAMPMVNKVEVIKVPDIFMGSPAVVENKRFEEYAGSMKFKRDEDHFTKCQRESCAFWIRPNTDTPRSPH